MGALKSAAMAPEAPQAISSTRCLYFSPILRPRFEPIAAPVLTDGPSIPTEPPNPSVIELVIPGVNMFAKGRRPFSVEMDCKTEGIP